MYIPWQQAELFITVAEFGSFSAAARQLRLTQPTVSRRIAALEDDLGRALFRRDSEGTHLTAEGERLLPAAEQMARWSNEMERAASSWDDTPTGIVRCAVPPGVAFELMIPIAARLRQQYPDLRLELLTGVEHIDLTRGDAELAIRTREPTQPELVVRTSFHTQIGVYAARSLADRFSDELVDASDLPWVTWSAPLEHVQPRPYLEAALDPFRIAFASNDYLVLRRAVGAGLGAFVIGDPTQSTGWGDDLVQLNTTLELPFEDAMHVVCARSMAHVPRVRVVADAVADALEGLDTVRVERHG